MEAESYDQTVLCQTVEVDHPVYARRILRENGRCVFNGDDHKCLIYDRRPVVCRLYPLQFNVSHDGRSMLCLDRCEGVYRGKSKLSAVLEETFADMPEAYWEFESNARSLILTERGGAMPLAVKGDTMVVSRYVDKARLMAPVRKLLARARECMEDETGERSIKKKAAAPVVSDPLVAAIAVIEANLPGLVDALVEEAVPLSDERGENEWGGAGGGKSSGQDGSGTGRGSFRRAEAGGSASDGKEKGDKEEEEEEEKEEEQMAPAPKHKVSLSPARMDALLESMTGTLERDMEFMCDRLKRVGERATGRGGDNWTGDDGAGGEVSHTRTRALSLVRRDLLGMELPFRFYSALTDFLLEIIDREGRLKGELYHDVPIGAQMRVIIIAASGCLETLSHWQFRADGLRELREAFEVAGSDDRHISEMLEEVAEGRSLMEVAGVNAGREAGGTDQGGALSPGGAERDAGDALDHRGGVGDADGAPPTGGAGGGDPAEADRSVFDDPDVGARMGPTDIAWAPYTLSLARRLASVDKGLATLLEEEGDLFTGSTVPASPMSVLKERFLHYESIIPRLYRRLPAVGYPERE